MASFRPLLAPFFVELEMPLPSSFYDETKAVSTRAVYLSIEVGLILSLLCGK